MVQPAGVGNIGDGQVFERIYSCLQMASRQVQVNAGGFQVGMSEQNLDGWQVGAVLQQVSGEAVPQGVIMVLTISFPLRSAIAITRATAQKSSLFAI